MSLRRGIYHTFLVQAPNLLLFFAASTLMTRMLGDTGRGEYTLFISQVALLAMLFGLNIGAGLTFYTARTGPEAETAAGTATTLFALNTVLIPLVLLFASLSPGLTGLIMPPHRTHWLYWGFIYFNVMMGLVNAYASALLLGMKKFGVLNGMGLFNAALSATGFLALFLFHDRIRPERVLPAVLLIVSGIALTQSILWAVMCILYVRLRPRMVWSWSAMRPVLIFSFVGHLSNLVNLINYRFDVWVVEEHRGAAQLGLYAAAVGLAQLLFYIPEPFARVVQPFLFGQEKNEMLPRFKALARLNFTAVLCCALLMGALAHVILPLLFGETFSPGADALRLLMPGILFSSTFKLLVQLVIQRGLQHFNLLASSAGAVFTIILDLVLIPVHGIEGAAIASTISYLVVLIVVLLVIRFRLRIPVHDLFLLRASDIKSLRTSVPWKPDR